jgi:hypothetical protein
MTIIPAGMTRGRKKAVIMDKLGKAVIVMV